MDFQETLFYHSKSFIRNEPTGLSCYIICRTQLKGFFDPACWGKTLNHIINCHPLLHSILSEESDKPEMITLPEYPTFKSSYEDITSMNKEQQETFFLQKDEKIMITDLTLKSILYSIVIFIKQGKMNMN